MILLWGIYNDPPLNKVRKILAEKGIEMYFLDHRKIEDTKIFIEYPRLKGNINIDKVKINITEVSAAYFRPYNFRKYPSTKSNLENFRELIQMEDILWSWAELTDKLVLNRPSDMQSNSSKPYQTILINSVGLKTPKSIYTTSIDFLSEFKLAHEDVIYKSVSGVRSIVRKLDLNEEKKLNNLKWCITQFQEYIKGYNIRVHVVGRKIFGTKIYSTADDYRYSSARLEEVKIPKDIKTKCFKVSKLLNLPLCGIDFKMTKDNDWVCFEVNPSPAYSYYEDRTNQKISEAIADLLINGK